MIGDILKKIREERGLTLRDLSAICGLTESAMSRIVRNQCCPRLKTIIRLEDGLGLGRGFFSRLVNYDRGLTEKA